MTALWQFVGVTVSPGAFGQGLMVIRGISKEIDTEERGDDSYWHNPARIGINPVFGAVAGTLAGAVFAMEASGATPQMSWGIGLSMVAAGYAGADFVEGFLHSRGSRYASRTIEGNGTEGN